MAKKRRRKAGRRSTRKSSSSAMPGWIYMLVGLSIGLAVAYGVYVSDRERLQQTAPAVPDPREPASTVPEAVESVPQQAVDEDAEEGITFDFYDMLPNLDVEVYDEKKPAPPTQPTPPAEVSRGGIYILQAGSFSRLEDANRRKAEMALLGVRSEIKQGTAGSRTVYRVYTTPMNNPATVNRVTNKLTGAGIEVLQKRVSD